MIHSGFSKIRQHSKDNLGEGTEEKQLKKLEEELKIKLPTEFRNYLKEIGYAEIYEDEIYSIYQIPDTSPCNGLDWMNKRNALLAKGFIEFFSNDLDGIFYMHQDSGKVYLNTIDNLYAGSFSKFIDKML